ncbi:DNA replication terminus site-binding protein [Erwiniaceae bacterium BAC15a-03b]|uniref:DNA replication terminus site-binding protein n=1 Tax=Winslowiella arboricola TaxID=2978220 RepID=A0A9J6PNA8_9GAMM|nr:DNA replication terminus site-binding protein [Winslowiella arboricola]MCU5772406.1 DNA replication terminus site-binding protein [Winslowiella arboricola]MCU5779801.1 DNA replication terminus site-binding protein [Winslowiella arboricola]
MSQYDAVAALHQCVNQLEAELNQLQQQLQSLHLLAGRVFSLPPVVKGKEHDPIRTIDVRQHLGSEALQLGMEHYCRLFMQHQSEQISTKAAVRLPGALCFAADMVQSARLHQQVACVNQLKVRLEQIITVESGVESEERFDFVHTHLRGLITLNAYRAITLLDAPNTVRFGWANKHIVKNLSRKEVLEKLERGLKAGRAVAPWSREQWAEKVLEEIEAIRSLPANARLKIKRPVKVQPIARTWNIQQQKQTQLACPSPLLVLCADKNQVPALGELLNYDAEQVKHRYKPQAEKLFAIIPRLHLYSDRLV